MEIEAKFLISERDTFEKLKGIETVTGFNPKKPVDKDFTDTYLDTMDMAIYASGFSFRCREKGSKVTYTLKSLSTSSSLVHMREEVEFTLTEKLPVKDWDNCVLRKRVIDIIGSGELFPLFTVTHKRTDILLSRDQRNVAEMSFDDVVLTCEKSEKSYLELEVELTGDGTEAEMNQIAEYFRDDRGLTPGSNSKFDNGLELFMENVRKNASILNYDINIGSKNTKYSPLQDMIEEYGIEREHARRVAENSYRLFKDLKNIHHVRNELIHTLRIASVVHDIGVMTNVKNHHKAGRDILSETCPDELPYPLCAFLPWMTFLHKKRIDRKKLDKLSLKKKFLSLPSQMQDDILKLAAILRMADALDYSRMESRISEIDLSKEDIIVKIAGKGASIDADRADTKADLWRLLFEKDIYFREDY
ncbi:exopolyphosphatase / guanosine-5'-triphosphate,3'-diphosphate pyrophosphatase [Methanolobus vulcani]|uniref:Exopolyphosphatase / guanosine-5'-triphosphate,3'-diphosphate pyrophosphatase n=1 Tax=Methanolobus vulcani TaxID=38026 RepID=A0A7Z7AVI3_9EURY|nr:CYTH domain-containing protein [Methanolobus vulcani]SDF29470.1 exopolyphosphatase / guanosine-5'-triphosphate,3'-diphosphate pyrophosphatase [Methanolobus vulcani]